MALFILQCLLLILIIDTWISMLIWIIKRMRSRKSRLSYGWEDENDGSKI